MTLTDILHRLDGVRGSGVQYSALCPVHGDQKASLSVGLGADGRILLKCHAGCTTDEILDVLGLQTSDLFAEVTPVQAFQPVAPQNRTPQGKLWKEAAYDYRDETGAATLRKVKIRHPDGGKHFYWLHLDGHEWKKGRGGRKPMLYTSGIETPNMSVVVEGEKDVETIGGLNWPAVTTPDGAGGKWSKLYTEELSGKEIAIIPDNDEPGRKFAETCASELFGHAANVRIADLRKLWTDIPAHGDVTDYLESGHTWESVVELICNTPVLDRAPKAAALNDSPKPLLLQASAVPYSPPRWTLAPYFQQGKGTLVQGDNGSGKTAFMCAIAAHITTGRPLLGMRIDAPGPVLILSVEDDLPVLRGRIEADGGDLSKCYFMNNAEGLSFISPEIETAVKTIGAKMIVFDPFQAFLGSGVDMFRGNETRPVLAKLFAMCDRNNCSCAIIAHMGKSSSDKSPVNRALGSVDIPAAMRSIIQVGRNPDNEEERVAVHVKCSNAPTGQSILYRVGNRGGVEWLGFSALDAEDIVNVAKRKEKGIPYDHEPLVQVFNQLITDKPGGGFWSYADLKSEGARILGFPPYTDLHDLRHRLDSGLARELQVHDGLIVTCGESGKKNVRGIRIEQYKAPEGYQTTIADG